MGPVRQNPIQRTVSLFICVCIALCTIVAHNIAQNRPDSFHPYPPDNHHISDDVYLREGGGKYSTKINTTTASTKKIPNLKLAYRFTGTNTAKLVISVENTAINSIINNNQ